MPIMEINIIPLGTKTPSVSKFIAEAVKVLKREGLNYELTSMATIVEGGLNDLFSLAKEMHLATFTQGVKRVVTTIKIDDRRDEPSTMEEKVKRVKQQINATKF